MAPGSGLANVLAALNQRNSRVRPHGGYYTAQCPAHEDRTASLSISQGEKGAVLNCHAGCDTDAIRIELNLPWPALFDNEGKESDKARLSIDQWMPCQSPEGKGGADCSGRKIAEYLYHDEEGVLLFAACRCSRKGDGCSRPFAQWRPDKSKKFGKSWNLQGVRRVIYRLPGVLKGIAEGRRIWVTEGEKDADLLCSMGEVATSAPMGAGAWLRQYATHFRGAIEVIVIADCDEPGLEHAEQVYRDVSRFCENVKVVCTPVDAKGADASDHFAYGLGFDDFEVVPFEEVERRPTMVIKVEPRHRVAPVDFRTYSTEALERSLVGSMMRYGLDYGVGEADVTTHEKLRIIAGAVSRIAAKGTLITPETVAVQIESEGKGEYESILGYLLELEKVAFSDAEKPTKAARMLRERTIKEGIVYTCRATEEAARDDRWSAEDLLAHLGRLADGLLDEFAQIAREYPEPVGDVASTVVASPVRTEMVPRQEAPEGNVRELRPPVQSPAVSVAQGG